MRSATFDALYVLAAQEDDEINLKKFGSYDEARRAVTKITRMFEETVKKLDQLKTVLSHAYTVLAVRVRGDGKNVGVIPGAAEHLKEIADSFSQIRALEQQKKGAESALQQIEYDLGEFKESAKLVRDLEKLIERIDGKLRDANKVAGAIAKKHVPQGFKTSVTNLLNDLETRTKGRIQDSYDPRWVIYPTQSQQLVYVAYLRFTGVVSDSGSVIDNLYIAVALSIHNEDMNKNGKVFYLNINDVYVSADRIRWTIKSGDWKNITKAIDQQLAANKFASLIAPRRIPIPESAILLLQRSHDIIENIELVEKSEKSQVVQVTFNPEAGEKDVDYVRARLIGDFRVLLQRNAPRNRDIINYQMFTNREGNKTRRTLEIKLTVPFNYQGTTITPTLWTRLTEIYHFPEHVIHNLQDLLEPGDDPGDATPEVATLRRRRTHSQLRQLAKA